MKILLTIAPWDLWENEDTTIYPMGLGYLATILEKNKYNENIRIGEDTELWVRILKEYP